MEGNSEKCGSSLAKLSQYEVPQAQRDIVVNAHQMVSLFAYSSSMDSVDFTCYPNSFPGPTRLWLALIHFFNLISIPNSLAIAIRVLFELLRPLLGIMTFVLEVPFAWNSCSRPLLDNLTLNLQVSIQMPPPPKSLRGSIPKRHPCREARVIFLISASVLDHRGPDDM